MPSPPRTFICPHDGHLLSQWQGQEAPFCPHHGAKLFTNCAHCGKPWHVTDLGLGAHKAGDFCRYCSQPGSWVARWMLIEWLRDKIRTEQLDEATKLELSELLDRVARMEPADPNTLTMWKRVKDAAPHVWSFGRPVLQTVIGAKLKALLEMGGP